MQSLLPKAEGVIKVSSKKIILTGEDKGIGFFGGGVNLNSLESWPLIPGTNEPMIHLVTLTENFLPIKFIPEKMAVSVFISAQKTGGNFKCSTQRYYTVNQQSELEKIKDGYARVILHSSENTEVPPPGETPFPQKIFINFEEMTAAEEAEELEDEDSGLEVSKPTGRPSWLQDPIYESSRHQFIMQILERDIVMQNPECEGLLANGVGYLYIDRQSRKGKENDEAGFFFIQFT